MEWINFIAYVAIIIFSRFVRWIVRRVSLVDIHHGYDTCSRGWHFIKLKLVLIIVKMISIELFNLILLVVGTLGS